LPTIVSINIITTLFHYYIKEEINIPLPKIGNLIGNLFVIFIPTGYPNEKPKNEDTQKA
jgi:hypothetical protein